MMIGNLDERDVFQKEYNNLTVILNKYFKEKSNDEEESSFEVSSLKTDSNTITTFGIKTLFKEYGVMLCGGTINSIFSSRQVNDLDFYVKDNSAGQISKLVDVMKERYGYKVVSTTSNAITLTKKRGASILEIQFITRFSGTPEFILDTFDFTIVQGIFDFSTNKFILADRFLPDIAKRQLVYTSSSKYPICALYRTKKYTQRGYNMSGANMVALALSIHALELKTYGDLKDQLMGIDTAMLNEITIDGDDNKKFEADEFVKDWLDLMSNFNDDGM